MYIHMGISGKIKHVETWGGGELGGLGLREQMTELGQMVMGVLSVHTEAVCMYLLPHVFITV